MVACSSITTSVLTLEKNQTDQSWLTRSGPTLHHHLLPFYKCLDRYPGGDCTSDIYVADMEKKAKL